MVIRIIINIIKQNEQRLPDNIYIYIYVWCCPAAFTERTVLYERRKTYITKRIYENLIENCYLMEMERKWIYSTEYRAIIL